MSKNRQLKRDDQSSSKFLPREGVPFKLATVWFSAAMASSRPVRGQLGEAFESVNRKKARFVNFLCQRSGMSLPKAQNSADFWAFAASSTEEGVERISAPHALFSNPHTLPARINPLKGQENHIGSGQRLSCPAFGVDLRLRFA